MGRLGARAAPGRDVDAILKAAADGALAALVVGGVDPMDFADPALAARGPWNAPASSSASRYGAAAVTKHADVVLPVAPAAEKAGRYVTWEGRRRPFDLTITNLGAMSDARVLTALAEELDVDLGLPSVQVARAELMALASSGPRATAPSVGAGRSRCPKLGRRCWPPGLNSSTPAACRTATSTSPAPPSRPERSSAPRRLPRSASLTAGRSRWRPSAACWCYPVVIDDIADRVVWVPTNARDRAVRPALGASAGAVVRLSSSDAPPVVGIAGGEQ